MQHFIYQTNERNVLTKIAVSDKEFNFILQEKVRGRTELIMLNRDTLNIEIDLRENIIPQ